MCGLALPKGLRVLVVDSNADAREILTMLFASYEIETIAATCVNDSLEIMQEIQPDLLISELVFPGEDGYSLISKVKAFETAHCVRIPVIALTVCTSLSDQNQALAAGFCKHLPKPLDIDQLIEAVAWVAKQAQEEIICACY